MGWEEETSYIGCNTTLYVRAVSGGIGRARLASSTAPTASMYAHVYPLAAAVCPIIICLNILLDEGCWRRRGGVERGFVEVGSRRDGDMLARTRRQTTSKPLGNQVYHGQVSRLQSDAVVLNELFSSCFLSFQSNEDATCH